MQLRVALKRTAVRLQDIYARLQTEGRQEEILNRTGAGPDQSPAEGVCWTEGLALVGMGLSISSWHIPPKARIGPLSRSWEGLKGVFIPDETCKILNQ